MGFSDSPNKTHLLSGADHHANGCNFLSRPASKELQELCQIAPSNERSVVISARFDHDIWRKMEEEAGGSSSSSSTGQVLLCASNLKVKVPEEVLLEEDGLSTPTSSDHKIPKLICPPAPRKPKSVPSPDAAKRKGCRKRVFLDLTNDIESLFPAAIRADFGNKIKKVRK